MREIKFRAKNAKTGSWVYGLISRCPKICNQEEYNKTGERCRLVTRVANYDVREETIGQYTGLKDGNDREIYEGDIIARRVLKSILNYQIVFNNGAFCLKTSDNELVPLMNIYLLSTCVIGNIYDNPELLKR